MTREVRIALIQQQGLTEDLAANAAELLATIDAVASAADVVMPTELCQTPYFGVLRDNAVREWAETIDGEFVQAVAALAARHTTTIVLPLYLRSGDIRENAALVIGPDGNFIEGECADERTRGHYAKVHLPCAWRGDRGLDEPFYFSRGTTFPVFDTPIGKAGILICYDRRFPEAWRSLVFAGAELVFVPSCVPVWSPGARASTADMLLAELRTRACENGVFVAACGRAGHQRLRDVDSQFVGRSCVIDPAGGLLDSASEEAAECLTVAIELEDVARTRRRLTVLQDRQPSAYDYGERFEAKADLASS